MANARFYCNRLLHCSTVNTLARRPSRQRNSLVTIPIGPRRNAPSRFDRRSNNANGPLRSGSTGGLPSNFGYNPHGPGIANGASVLREVDAALGVSKPPDLEVFLTEHLCGTTSRLSTLVHLHLLRFGHVAIRYRTSDGADRLMNIHGDFSSDPDAKMVNFIDPPADYLFGTDPNRAGQGGVYNRPIVSVRVEKVAEGATDALHAYYLALDKASAIGAVGRNRTLSSPNGQEENDAANASIGDNTYNGNRQGPTLEQPGSSRRGSVRFQLVDVNLSSLARSLPEPFGRIPLKIATFFQRQHERAQQGGASASGSGKDNPLVKTLSSAGATMKNRGGKLLEQFSAAEQGAQIMYDDVRAATFEAGNCAQWTSRGLSFCGLLRRPRLFPKSILVELLEDEYLVAGRKDNVHVVVYEEVEHAKKKTDWGSYKYLRSAYVHPLRPLRNWWYGEPRDFASVIVSVPKGSDKAIVQRQDRLRRQPRQVFRFVSVVSAVVPATIMVGLVDHIGPMGPVAAAAWLALNWWLH